MWIFRCIWLQFVTLIWLYYSSGKVFGAVFSARCIFFRLRASVTFFHAILFIYWIQRSFSYPRFTDLLWHFTRIPVLLHSFYWVLFWGNEKLFTFSLLYRNENIYLHVYSKCSSKTCNSISTNRAICLACSLDCVPFRMTIITTATNWKWKFTNSILICSFLLASFYLSTACLMKLFDITFSPWGKYKQLAKQLQFRRERKKRIEVSSRHNQIILSSCHST